MDLMASRLRRQKKGRLSLSRVKGGLLRGVRQGAPPQTTERAQIKALQQLINGGGSRGGNNGSANQGTWGCNGVSTSEQRTNHKRGEGDSPGTSLSLDASPGSFQNPGKGPEVTDRATKRKEGGLTGTGAGEE
ncbi:hypothetical protein DUI87_13106 [Hirundo rustica rustica]|uniref:Uncharacterized protein n=1 Tax=Hirundo rustica rustica TaxID=333673 RepID=A0A3M0KGE7_HIRRU|nr:hypothetical protein DUI87_13106 [Hirundo rustica rustica]